MPGPIARRFFTYHELRGATFKVSVFRSYASNGFLGSGKPYCAVASDGILKLFSEPDVQRFVLDAKLGGMVDTYDPYL